MRIVTWNMQGGSGTDIRKNGVLARMFGGGFDVICLQETTSPLDSFNQELSKKNGAGAYRQMVNRPGTRAYSNSQSLGYPSKTRGSDAPGSSSQYVCYYYQWGVGNSRCSLATYVRYGAQDYGLIFIDKFPSVRQLLWVKVNDCYIGNLHLISGRPKASYVEFLLMKDRLKDLCTKYVLIGDFNINLLSNDSPEMKKLVAEEKIHSVQKTTQLSGGCLDYMYYEGVVQKTSIYNNDFISDHLPIEYEIYIIR